jgi:hypothetical protein
MNDLIMYTVLILYVLLVLLFVIIEISLCFNLPLHLHKIGLPLSWNDVKMMLFVYRTRKRWVKLDDEHFLVKKNGEDYTIWFNYTWLFQVYEGNIVNKKWYNFSYCLGGQSNRNDSLTFWQKWFGKKIENYYCQKYNKAKDGNAFEVGTSFTFEDLLF